MKMRVTYSIGTDKQKITEVIEVNNWGMAGARSALGRMYPNKVITIHDCKEIYGS